MVGRLNAGVKKMNIKKYITRKNLPTIIAVATVIVLTVATVVAVIIINKPSGNFYGHDAKVVSSIPAKDFDGITTPSEVKKRIDDLGFAGYQVIACYSMDGEYLGEDTIIDYDDVPRPTYDIEYTTAAGDYWVIYICGDQIMANPVTYNLQSSREVRVIISEKDTLTSYSGDDNTFYEIIPSDTEVLVLTVEKIDAETLEGLTKEALDEL